MTKSELIANLAEKTNLKKVEVTRLLDAFTETIKTELQSGGVINLPTFGKLMTKVRPGRKGINPKTKESLDIQPKTVVRFRQSSEFTL